jgi:murein L,D-transpeptidase YafK
MLKFAHKFVLVLGLVWLAFHIATPSRGIASEVPDTVEQSSDPVAQIPPAGKLPATLLSLDSTTGTFSQYAFLVDKKARTLTVWQHDGDKVKLVSAWPTDIGQKDGDKLVEGDKRTPEGVYFFQTAMDGKKVNYNEYGNRIFTLDYPNYFDRLEKKTGNGIWFHAIPPTKSLLRGSRGCVVVRNEVIDHLAQFVELRRTPMVISDSVEYIDVKQWQDLRTRYRTWLEDWRQSWMGKDIESYLAWYSDRFMSNGMNKRRWRSYKRNLANYYKFIEVQLKDVQIFNQGHKIVLRFAQSYKSDKKEDFGWKILYALKTGDKYEIVGESWEALPGPGTTAQAGQGSSAAN